MTDIIASEFFCVVRGGSWDNHSKYSLVANRIDSTSDRRSDVLSVRLMRRFM